MSQLNRRQFMATGAAAATAAFAAALPSAAQAATNGKKFQISLAAWSLNPLFGSTWTNLDLPRIVREDFGLEGIEFVNRYFALPRYDYLKELKKRCADYGITPVLIMVDGEGDMSHPDKAERRQAVINHRKWIDIADFLGCHAIRGNAGYEKAGTIDDRVARCAESYSELMEYADGCGMEVTIENHGGFSSIPEKLIAVMKTVNHPRFGTLPDFGNFPPEIDRYDALQRLMPYAKAVSAKCYDFDADGKHGAFDLDKMVEIVLAAGYNGFVGIEYEGTQNTPYEGVRYCKKILQKHQK